MIYWIQGDVGGPVKVGYTKALDPDARIKGFQTGYPYRLVARHVEDGDLRTEREIHEQLAEARLVGEWFAPTPEVCERGYCLPDRGGPDEEYAKGYAAGYAAGREAGHAAGREAGKMSLTGNVARALESVDMRLRAVEARTAPLGSVLRRLLDPPPPAG